MSTAEITNPHRYAAQSRRGRGGRDPSPSSSAAAVFQAPGELLGAGGEGSG